MFHGERPPESSQRLRTAVRAAVGIVRGTDISAGMSHNDKTLIVAVGVLIAGIVLPIVGFAAVSANHHTVYSHCRVNGHDRATGAGVGSGRARQLLYTSCGVMAVKDSFFAGRSNSASLYVEIRDGKTYRFDTIGLIFPVVSDFPNILTATEEPA